MAPVLNSVILGCVPKSGIVGVLGMCTFNFYGCSQTISHELLALSDGLILAILVSVQWCLIAILIEILGLLMMWYNFIYLCMVIFISSFVRYDFKSLVVYY